MADNNEMLNNLSAIEGTLTRMGASKKHVQQMLDLFKSISSESKKGAKLIEDFSDNLSVASKRAKDLDKAVDGYNDKIAESAKRTRNFERSTKKSFERVKDIMEESGTALTDSFDNSFASVTKIIDRDFMKVMDKLATGIDEKLKKGVSLTPDDFLTMQNLDKVKSRIENVKEALEYRGKGFFNEAFAKGGAIKKFMNQIKSDLKGSDVMGNLRNTSRAMQSVGGSMGGKTGALIKGAGSVVGSSVATGIASLAVKAIPVIGTVITGMMALGKVVMQLDDIYKSTVRDYVAMGGAQRSGTQAVRDANRYNEAIRDPDRNMQLGVNKDEWNAMFQSFHAGGLAIGNVTDRIGDMDKVMRLNRFASLEMGTTMDVTADIMANMNTEMKSAAAIMESNLSAVAKGARVAGIETVRFYQSIQASTLAMGTYGDFTEYAAAMLAKFLKSGMSQSQAEGHVKAALSGFQNMSTSDRLMYANMAESKNRGGGSIIAEFAQKTLADMQAKIDSGKLSEEELAKTTLNKRVLQEKLAGAKNADGSFNINALVSVLDTAGIDKMQLDAKIIENIFGKALGDIDFNDANVRAALESLPEALRGTAEGMRDTMNLLKGGLTEVQSPLNTFLMSQKDAGAADRQNTSKLISLIQKGEGNRTLAETGELKDMFKNMGMDSKQVAVMMSQLTMLGPALVEEIKKASNANYKGMSIGGVATRAYTMKGELPGEGMTGQQDLISKTTSISKRMGILTDAAIYQLASNELSQMSANALVHIQKDVARIASKLLGKGGTREEINKNFEGLLKKVDSNKTIEHELAKASTLVQGFNTLETAVGKKFDASIATPEQKRARAEELIRAQQATYLGKNSEKDVSDRIRSLNRSSGGDVDKFLDLATKSAQSRLDDPKEDKNIIQKAQKSLEVLKNELEELNGVQYEQLEENNKSKYSITKKLLAEKLSMGEKALSLSGDKGKSANSLTINNTTNISMEGDGSASKQTIDVGNAIAYNQKKNVNNLIPSWVAP